MGRASRTRRSVAGKASDSLGASVALSGDTAIVGAPGINGQIGGAFVYVRSGATWTKQAQLTPAEASFGDYAGETVALLGNTALVSVPGRGSAESVYMFQRSGTSWKEKKKLVPSDGAATDHFGQSLALSANAVFIGAYEKQVDANAAQGRVYIFSGSTWDTELKMDSPAGKQYGYFGISLVVDGNRLVVGEPGQNSVHTYYSDHGNWTLQSSLIDVIGSYFGNSVAASSGTVVVGARDAGNGSHPGGRAHIFQDDRIFANSFD